LSLALLTACLKEDLSVCGITVRFKYDLNPEGKDKFPTDFKSITLYVYNQSGTLVGEYKDTGPFGPDYKMRLNLRSGNYTFVAWGDLSDDTPVSSQNSLSAGSLSLKTGTDNKVEKHPLPLYHGSVSNLGVRVSNNSEVLISMMKDTKTVKLIFNGPFSSANADNFVSRITAVNGDYDFYNNIKGNRLLTYIPITTFSAQGPSLNKEFVTMRLFANNWCKSKLIFEYVPNNGSSVVTLINDALTDLIIKQYQALIDSKYNGDAAKFFIIEDVFILEFEVKYTFGNYTITVNGWTPKGNSGGTIVGY